MRVPQVVLLALSFPILRTSNGLISLPLDRRRKDRHGVVLHQERIPNALKNGVHVRFYSLLFEGGVDIRQWGAYAVSSMKSQLGTTNKTDEDEKLPTGGLIEDEDDDTGFSDEDFWSNLIMKPFER